MGAPFASLEARLAAVTCARLANVVVWRENGASFTAEFDESDSADFDMQTPASLLTYRLSLAPDLAIGETLFVREQAYQVAAAPQRVSAHIARVQIVRGG